jgi:glycerophosphoryl diester phosphodiesterase
MRRLLILAALDAEYEALQKHFRPDKRPSGKQLGSHYRCSRLHANGKRNTYVEINVALVGKGPAKAAAHTILLLHEYDPTDILLVGVAGGIRAKKQSVGDVLIAEQLYDLSEGEITDRMRITHPRGDTASEAWVRAAFSDRDNWQVKAVRDLMLPTRPGVYRGAIVSGGDVVSSAQHVKGVLTVRQLQKVIGFEMELAGVLAAIRAVEESRGRPQWCMIKCVSDFADHPDNRKTRKANTERAASIAAHMAAHAAALVLAEVPSDTLQPHRPTALVHTAKTRGTIANLDDLLPYLSQLISSLRDGSSRRGRSVMLRVENIALDGEQTVPWLRDFLERNAHVTDIEYRMLLLDPRAHSVRSALVGGNIKASNVYESLGWIEALNRDFRSRNIQVIPRLYRTPLPFHGFCVDRKRLFIGHTLFGAPKGRHDHRNRDSAATKFRGAAYPYAVYGRDDQSDDLAAHQFDVYLSWFEYLWRVHLPVARQLTTAVPLIIGHRGSRRDSKYTENTIAAMQVAVESGCKAIEVDVQVTSDGVPVVFHDKNVDRVTKKSGVVRDMELKDIADLRTYPHRALIPTLEQVCRYVRDHELLLAMEIVDFSNWSRIMDVATIALGASSAQLIPCSFDHRVVASVKQKYPKLATAAIIEGVPADLPSLVVSSGCDIVSLGIESYSVDAVKQLREMGIGVWVWTVNSAPVAERLTADGVTGIITDRPDLLVPVMSRKPRAAPIRHLVSKRVGSILE